MTSMSQRLLGLDPIDVGGATAKASFAKALTERCVDGDRIDALVDVILVSRQGVDPRVRDVAGLYGKEELAPGKTLGPFAVLKKLGDSELSTVYLTRRGNEERVLKVLKREACRDKRAVQRLLTANRLVASVDHAGLPKGIDAGETDGSYWISYVHVDAQTLSARLARTGPSHINELKPTLHAILEPLAALHQARIVHGDLKLENVLVGRSPEGGLRVTLIDFGTDRLRQRPTVANGHTGVLAVIGSPKTIAPEQVRGLRADSASDVYSFGAMMYELLSGKPVFAFDTATDAAFAHVSQAPEPPSAKAPRGWITKDVDQFVLALLAKDPAKRPKDAAAVLDQLESLGRASSAMRAAQAVFPEERLTTLIDLLIAAPDDAEAAIALEAAIEEGADATKVAEAFDQASDGVDLSDEDGLEVKKSLLYRAGRIFDAAVKDKERAERVYAELVELDPKDEIALIALDEVRKALGKYEEIVESLMARSELEAPGEERSRIFAEIGRICATELEDPDQGILAYARALCEAPTTRELADEIERLAGGKVHLWNEVLAPSPRGARRDAVVDRAQQAPRVRGPLVRAEARTPRHGAAGLPADPHDRSRERRGLRGAHERSTARRSSGPSSRGARRPRRRGRQLSPRPRSTHRGGGALRAEAQRRRSREGDLRAGPGRGPGPPRRRATRWRASPSARATSSRSCAPRAARRVAARSGEGRRPRSRWPRSTRTT
jgi:serine/threonine protein kinase